MASGGRFKTKTTVQKDGSVYQEQIPMDAVVDDSIKAEGETEEQEEEELTADEARYLHVARKLAGSMLKFKIFRIVDGGGERYCGSITAEQFDQDDPVRSIQTRYGGGSFKVYFPDPENPSQDFSAEYQIEGEPKFGKEEATPAGNVTLQMPKQTDNSSMVVTSMMNFMSNQLLESQKMTNALMLKLAEPKPERQQQASIAGMTLDQLAVIKELFADKKKENTGETLREVLGVVKTIVETVPSVLGQQSETAGWLGILQNLAPRIGDALGVFASKMSGAPAARPIGAPSGQTPQQQQQAQQEGANVVRQIFEQMYLNPLIQAALEDVDPYTMTFNFKAQLGGNTADFLPQHLGLKSVPDFYERYPATAQYRDWFNEFFFYMQNPEAKPAPDEDEEEEEVPANGKDKHVVAEVVDVTQTIPKKSGSSAEHMAKMREAKKAKEAKAEPKQ